MYFIVCCTITEPNTVNNLRGTLHDQNTIEVDWDGPADSRWTYYLVKHRDILRNSQSSWVINSTYSPNLTMPDRFPGEKYEIQVFAVSESVRSDVQMIHIIVGKF